MGQWHVIISSSKAVLVTTVANSLMVSKKSITSTYNIVFLTGINKVYYFCWLVSLFATSWVSAWQLILYLSSVINHRAGGNNVLIKDRRILCVLIV